MLQAFIAALLVAGTPGKADSRTAETDLLYAMGALLGAHIKPLSLSSRELDVVKRGFADAAAGRKLRLDDPDLEEWGPRVDAFLSKRGNPKIAAQKERGRPVLESEASQPGAVRTPTGLVYRPLREGAGATPARTSTVRVEYQGHLVDGTVFDSSSSHGGPAEFRLDQVIPCWTEGVQRMKAGGKARLVCPSSIAYGDQGRPPQIPAGATLIFDIELLDVRR